MSNRNEIIQFANGVLELDKYPDYGPMGCQHLGAEHVTKICTATSVSSSVICRAEAAGAQMLIVHHGMFWNNESRILDERVGGRLRHLQEAGITLLAYHLALDAHDVIGNNKLAAKTLGLRKLKRFEGIGYGGEYLEPMERTTFREMVRKEFGDTGSFYHPILYPEGTNLINRVAVIVGGAAQYIVEAHRQGYDTFFTGEAAEQTIYLAQDLGMNFIAAGHDRTERAGVQQLAKIIGRKFRTETEFLAESNLV